MPAARPARPPLPAPRGRRRRPPACGGDSARDHAPLLRGGFTLVELLVVIAIMGVLVALLLPAVQAAREASRRMACTNHLKQLALASANFESATGKLPPSRLPCNIGTWLVALWPYLERSDLADAWDQRKTYYFQETSNQRRQVDLFYCPSRRSAGENLLSLNGDDGGGVHKHRAGALSDYAACAGDGAAWDYPLQFDQPPPFANGPFALALADCGPGHHETAGVLQSSITYALGVEDVEDGLSNTLFFGEKHVPLEVDHGSTGQRIGAWGRIEAHDTAAYNGDNLERFARFGGPGYPLALGPQDSPPAEQNFLFGGSHPQVVLFALGDGSVKPASVALDTGVLRRWTQRADGEAAAGWR